jgi:hypothetical protein
VAFWALRRLAAIFAGEVVFGKWVSPAPADAVFMGPCDFWAAIFLSLLDIFSLWVSRVCFFDGS